MTPPPRPTQRRGARRPADNPVGGALLALAVAGLAACGGGDSADGGSSGTGVPTPVPAPQPWLADAPSTLYRSFADTPVRWWPWGEEAFALARELDRPVFLVIGYPSCPWTARMRRESFAAPAIASYVNAHSVPVIVDCELRPDVNDLYMRYAQVASSKASWPLCVWLTPDRLPLSSTTFVSNEATESQQGLLPVLEHVGNLWEKFPDHYRDQTRRDAQRFVDAVTPDPAHPEWQPDWSHTEAAFSRLAAAYDPVNGGFTGRPKFLYPSKLLYLLDYADPGHPGPATRENRDRAVAMVRETLTSLAGSAMLDQLGSGVFRYSGDSTWDAPNFEKALFDQALAATALLRGFQATGDTGLRVAARSLLGYIEERLRCPGGGYFGGEGAESAAATGPDGEPAPDAAPGPGLYYAWTPEQTADALAGEAPDTAALFNRAYAISSRGNLPPGSVPKSWAVAGMCIPRLAATPAEAAAALGLALDPDQATALVEHAKAALAEARGLRPRPPRDEKVILAWNAYLVSTFTTAAAALGQPSYLEKATALAEFLTGHFWDAPGATLYRCRFGDQLAVDAVALDYAALVRALLDLHAATGEERWSTLALTLQDRMDAQFRDPSTGAYTSAANRGEFFHLFANALDGAEPSAFALAADNLVRLAALTGDPALRLRAEATLRAASPQVLASPADCPTAASAILRFLSTASTRG